MNKTHAQWLIFASALITLATGCYSIANRPSFAANAEEVIEFVFYSSFTLMPFWISLMIVKSERTANLILAMGSFLISIFGSWLYYSSLIINGKAEAIFALLFVPAFQLCFFLVLWLITYVANKQKTQ